MKRAALLALLAAGCHSSPSAPEDAYRPLDAPAHPGAGPGGGLLDQLTFAVVGDTRPANVDDTANYPSPIVSQIFGDVAADPAQPRFVVTTGDYMFASVTGGQVDPQLDAYLGARAAYTGIVYPAMGNHECNGYTDSNCGPSGKDNEPANYTEFVARMIMPLGEVRPYYVERFAATDGSWSAKFIFIAANAWDNTQAAWLDNVLAEPSTYTFVVRHEPPDADTAPGVGPTTLTLAKFPLTMLLCGHTHTYQHVPAYREILVGNGGAPLTGSINYGFVIVQRQADGTLQVTSKDYQSLQPIDQFVVNPDGTVH
ncbi:MAG TPA: metallophosphoesterase [Kofleriaceae bacterium]